MQEMKFSMPMFRSFVPESVRPWIYLLVALSFQVSGARYLGALNEQIGGNAEMREDVLMCLYCNLAGMALWFPMLFRMKFRYVKHILLLVCLFEGLFATEHILEEIFLEEVMHYPTITNASLCLPPWTGNVAGCLFSLRWLQMVMRMSYIRLGIIGTTMLFAYLVMMYLMVSPSLSIKDLYLPLFCRGFAYTTLSIVFMASLHDVMDFNHFFQGLSVFNMLHMVIGGYWQVL